jgi:hypothetical protein
MTTEVVEFKPTQESFANVKHLSQLTTLRRFFSWLRSSTMFETELNGSSRWSVSCMLDFLRANPGVWKIYIRPSEWETNSTNVCGDPICPI